MTLNKAAVIAEPRHWNPLYLLLLAVALFGMSGNLNAQASGATVSYLPALGGLGGSQFQAQCGPTENLMGFELRVGAYVDAIRPVCVVTYGPTAFGNQTTPADWSGGPGGHLQRLMCPASAPVVIGIDVGTRLDDRTMSQLNVSRIHLYCGLAAPGQKSAAQPAAIFDAPYEHDRSDQRQDCPANQVAVGVNGKSGQFLDALGLICGAPRRDTSGKALGRVQPTAPAVAMSICDRAKDARARNSPVAAALEAQCEASKHPAGPPVALGRTGTPSPNAASVPICDQAQSALARNSPVAPQLVARCKAIGGGQGMPVEETPDQLAAKGQMIASQDVLVAELRRRQPAGNQRGFDIGMGAAEGQTAWGPGKQKMLASLNAPQQEGFKVAVSFTMDRNRNAQFASIGAAIAKADPVVASARTADPEVRAWLGFDIASGIFGDPAKGALNKTSAMQFMAIREQLSLPAQRGFNASMKFHQGRHYQQPIK